MLDRVRAFLHSLAPTHVIARPRLTALVMALIYAAVCAAYIVVSGAIARRIAVDTEALQTIERAKGLLFVMVSAAVLYALSSQLLRRIRSEHVVRERAEATARLLFEASPLPMWVHDLDTLRIIAVNEAAIRHYGYAREEFLRMTMTDIRPPEDVPRLLSAMDAVRRGGERRGIWRHRRKDGVILDVDLFGHTISYNGHPSELVLVRDVTDQLKAEAARAVAEEDLQNAVLNLRRLSARTRSIREEEQQRIARELHDDIGQLLTTLKLHVARARRNAPDPMADQLAGVSGTADLAIGAIQRICAGLRPLALDRLGLVAAIEQEAERLREGGMETSVDAAKDLETPDAESSTALFRITQEAVTNILRHAHARRATIRISRVKDQLQLEIEDDGVGLPPHAEKAPTALGLLGMRERAATLGGEVRFELRPGGGTRLVATIPSGGPS